MAVHHPVVGQGGAMTDATDHGAIGTLEDVEVDELARYLLELQ